MKTYLLPRANIDNVLECISMETRNISLPKSFPVYSKKLEYTKSKLDKFYNDKIIAKKFDNILRLFDHFRDIKRIIAKDFNAQHVTNAWVKFWEIISYFKIIPRKYHNEKQFRVFCNACLPGSDILAINHYINSKTNIKDFSWRASSLIENIPKDAENKENAEIIPLQDTYNLYRNYKGNWIMDGKINNGDVLSVHNQLDIQTKIGSTISLYTSDLGFDVSDDYNGQESQHAPYNLGQILSALLTLDRDGCMIVKLYTFFTPFTLSLLTLVTSMFKYNYLCKPASSKAANSETYFVCVGFEGMHDKVKDCLIGKLSNFSMTPIVDSDKIDNWNSFQGVFNIASKIIFEDQIRYINHSIFLYEKYKDTTYTVRREVEKFTNEKYIINKWLSDYCVKRLDDNCKLITLEK